MPARIAGHVRSLQGRCQALMFPEVSRPPPVCASTQRSAAQRHCWEHRQLQMPTCTSLPSPPIFTDCFPSSLAPGGLGRLATPRETVHKAAASVSAPAVTICVLKSGFTGAFADRRRCFAFLRAPPPRCGA